MSLKSKIQALITAANTKTGETDTTLTAAVQTLVDGYGQGGTPVINPLSVTANGTYTAPSGVDGYSPVTVNVQGGGGLPFTTAETITVGANDITYTQEIMSYFYPENIGENAVVVKADENNVVDTQMVSLVYFCKASSGAYLSAGAQWMILWSLAKGITYSPTSMSSRAAKLPEGSVYTKYVFD